MKKMSKGMLMTALICGAVYLGNTPVYASELQEFALDEYVVTAARTETKLVDTPANISVVDSQTIEERHYQDVSEVLKDVPGANVLDNGNGAYEKAISINGDTRVLVLVDGRRVDFASGTSTGRASFDMNMLPDVSVIDRIEILKGAGGALYGSDAVGGVVNIITKKANTNHGKVSVGFGSNDSRDMSAMYSLKENKTGVMISASKNKQGYYKYRDVLSKKTVKWPGSSEFKNEKISLNISQEFDDTSNLEIGYDYSKYEGCSSGNLGNIGRLSFNEKETKNLYAKYNWIMNDNDSGYLQIYHNEYNYFSIKTDGREIYGEVEEKTKGIDLQQSFTVSENNKLVAGTSWRDTDVDNPGHYNDGIDNFAIFVNDTWEFAPTWTLNTGVRYDDHSKAGNETTVSTGLNKKFNESSHAYINWGQVFKAPTTGDLFEFSIDDYGYKTVGNPNLKPETGDTWTIGYQTEINDDTNVSVSYFKSDLEDAIGWEGSEPDQYGDYKRYDAINIAKQKKQGLEISVDHKLNSNLDVVASYSYIKVENDDLGFGYVKDNNYIPNLYRLGVKYHEGKWNVDAYLRYGTGANTTDGYPYNGNWYGKYTDSRYVTVDLAITYKATKDLSFYAKGYNLFNEAYADYGGTTNYRYNCPAQSRRFIVGAEYKF